MNDFVDPDQAQIDADYESEQDAIWDKETRKDQEYRSDIDWDPDDIDD
jgi:hypothetical protein